MCKIADWWLIFSLFRWIIGFTTVRRLRKRRVNRRKKPPKSRWGDNRSNHEMCNMVHGHHALPLHLLAQQVPLRKWTNAISTTASTCRWLQEMLLHFPDAPAEDHRSDMRLCYWTWTRQRPSDTYGHCWCAGGPFQAATGDWNAATSGRRGRELGKRDEASTQRVS